MMIVPPDIAAQVAASGPSSSALLSTLGGLIAVLLALAGGIGTWAALRVGKNAQVLSNYKNVAESWEARARAVEAERDAKDEQLRQATAQIAELHAKNAALMDMASGHPAIEKLAAEMRESFSKLDSRIGSQ